MEGAPRGGAEPVQDSWRSQLEKRTLLNGIQPLEKQEKKNSSEEIREKPGTRKYYLEVASRAVVVQPTRSWRASGSARTNDAQRREYTKILTRRAAGDASPERGERRRQRSPRLSPENGYAHLAIRRAGAKPRRVGAPGFQGRAATLREGARKRTLAFTNLFFAAPTAGRKRRMAHLHKGRDCAARKGEQRRRAEQALRPSCGTNPQSPPHR